jgi:poly(glycerol-phosphate) alpha-glucosyltransferase
MTFAADFNVLFLNIDLGTEFTGIEAAAMIRGRIMDRYLDLPTHFVSLYFNPTGYSNFQRYRSKGLVAPGMRWANLFDWLQGIDPESEVFSTPYEPPAGCLLAPVDGTEHDQRLYCQGMVQAYLKCDDSTGRPIFINYLRDGKIWKRDWFGLDGRVRRTDFVDPVYETADPVLEYFWDSNGAPVLVRDYEFHDKKQRAMRTLQRFEQGRISHHWSHLDDLHEHFLSSLLDPNKVNVLILDRSSEFGNAATRLREKHPGLVKLVGMVHNTHYVHGIHTPGHPMSSDLSSFYKEMLLSRENYDALVFLTQTQVNDVQRRFGPGPYHVIPHAFEPGELRPSDEREWHRIVVPGRFAEEKQPLMAIEAFAKVRSSCADASLHFYGYGDKRAQMIERIEQLGLTESVFLHDFDSDIDRVFDSAGLMLCSSRNEGFCISVLQAIGRGCPVVAFDCNYGPAEIVSNGVNGFLCAPQDVDGMAQAILDIFHNPTLHRRLVDQSPASVASFAESQVARRWAELLDSWRP